MKIFTTIYCELFFYLTPLVLFSQVKIGDHPQTINPYTILEIESSKQDILIPRLTSAQRDRAFKRDIPHALMIYNRTNNCLEIYLSDIKQWRCLQNKAEEKEIKLHLKNNALSLDHGEKIDLSPYLDNTDDQKLSLNGTTIALEHGGQVDLGPLLVKNNAPNLKLNGTILSLENGGNVDLAPLFESIQGHQKIDLFEVKDNNLLLSLADDQEPPKTIDLSKVNTDNQTLELKNNTLKITRGNTVNLSPFLDNTDQQQLTLSLSNTSTARITIENGNSITLKGGNNILLSLQNSQTLLIDSKTGAFTNENETTSNALGDYTNDNFVFGSSQLENIKESSKDNKRFFFDKSKAAFRAGIAQSDQWDDQNIGTYSVAMGRNTIASGYHATAFGSNTHATAWYATAMGNGTSAVSNSEIAIGRYNTTYIPLGGTRNWEPTDRLFVIGNGTGKTKTLRSNALVMLKNGNTTVSGVWTGPGFTNLSDKRLKTNIASLSFGLETTIQLKPKQYYLKSDPSKKTHFGLLASEVKKIRPELVYTSSGNNELLSINYNEIIPILIVSIKQLKELLDQQNSRIKKLESQ